MTRFLLAAQCYPSAPRPVITALVCAQLKVMLMCYTSTSFTDDDIVLMALLPACLAAG
jgi:hypothetical protein